MIYKQKFSRLSLIAAKKIIFPPLLYGLTDRQSNKFWKGKFCAVTINCCADNLILLVAVMVHHCFVLLKHLKYLFSSTEIFHSQFTIQIYKFYVSTVEKMKNYVVKFMGARWRFGYKSSPRQLEHALILNCSLTRSIAQGIK